MWGTDRQICPKGHCLASRGLPSDAKQWPEGQICLSVPHSCGRFFFLHIFKCWSFNYIKDSSRHCFVMSSILTTVLIFDVVMTSASDEVTWRPIPAMQTEVTRKLSFFYPIHRSDNQGKIRISNPSKKHGYPYLGCKKIQYAITVAPLTKFKIKIGLGEVWIWNCLVHYAPTVSPLTNFNVSISRGQHLNGIL